MRDYTKLRGFELADEVAVLIYRMTKEFPKEEINGLTTQMSRATDSATSNVVEECAHESQNEYLRFLEIAFAFLREVHYQFGLAIRLGYVKESDANEYNLKLAEAEKVIRTLARRIRNG
ncbi:MAG: four helix bundle protein [Bacteroidota bacterium]|jgi:four helix bundle protein